MSGFEPILSYGDDAFVCGTLGPVMICAWSGPVEVPHVEAMHETQLALADQFPAGVSMYAVAPGGTPMPNSDVRRATLSTFPKTRLAVVSVALLGDGFWLSAARSVLTTILYLGRGKVAVEFFADLDKPAAWQHGRLPECPSPPEILAAVDRLKSMV